MGDGKTRTDLVCFGECMVELSRAPQADLWRMAFAGDTANVAVYSARLGASVAFLSAIGADAQSTDMRDFLESEGIDPRFLLAHPEKIPGLYAINTDAFGERSFTYWRENSAARSFFDAPGASEALVSAADARLLYLSGITLSLFDEIKRERVATLATMVRERGGMVAFDGNYRPRGWSSADAARHAFAAFASQCDIVLPTFEDEVALFGDSEPAETIARWHGWGAELVVVKLGAEGALVSAKGAQTQAIACPERRLARDTTGAGDSFNAGFLSAFLRGGDAIAAVRAGHALAGNVIMHPGAIIPKEAMPA